MMREVSARELVVTELLRFEAAGQYANLTLDAALRRNTALTPRDRALATAMFYGVIEHRITLDAVIDALSTLPPQKIEARVRMILRLGLCQLLYFDRIPDHAAVAETVELAPRRSRGFVNALLRAFCRGGKEIPCPAKETDLMEYLSVRYSVPTELAAAFCRGYGAEKTEAMLAAFSCVPPITVRVNTLRLTREEFLLKVAGATPTKIAPYGAHLPKDAPLQELLCEGLCFVQDEASQICVEAVGASRGERVMDVCAAPGSKSFGMALSMENTGEVHSFDLHENKMSLILREANALGLSNLTARAADAREASPETRGVFDRVLCDVPCSGFGVLSKKPDIRYKSVSSAAGLPAVQKDILSAAAACVRAGGVLVYSTCTLLKEENEAQVTAFLAEHGDFSLSPFTVGTKTFDGAVTLTPDEFGTDGFFIARFCRHSGE